MTILMELEDDVNKIARAIAAALKVDVEIADTDLIKVAVVGKLEYLKKDKLYSGFGYKKSIKTGKKYVIDLPGENKFCQGCEGFGKCIYKMAVYAPIKGDNEIIGVISLTAFNEEQYRVLKENIEANLSFVDVMANLIYSRVAEKRMLKEMVIITEKLNQVMDSIDSGIIATDKEGKITHINQIAMNKLGLRVKKNVLGKIISNIFPSLHYEKILNYTDKKIKKQEICNLKSTQDKYIINSRRIFYKGEVQGMVLSLERYDDAKNSAYTLVSVDRPMSMDDIIGQSKVINDVKEIILKVSQSNSIVMLTGETGTGKEVFSRAIHYHSLRKDRPFVTINCSAIPDSLIESELFGYEKGAFTGANKLGKPGKFEIANGGTVLLDEIEAMPIYMQPKILRVIQEKEVTRVGSNETIPVDVRIISATNVDLRKAVSKGQFRADLFHRLNVIPIIIPPLRKRKDDIPLLVDYFINIFAKMMDRDIKGIDNKVEELFLSYTWPGNVRELRNTIEYAINLEESEYITINNIHLNIRDFNEPLEHKVCSLKEVEKHYIKEALNKYGWDEKGKLMAAKKLGISRATIYRKIKDLEISS